MIEIGLAPCKPSEAMDLPCLPAPDYKSNPPGCKKKDKKMSRIYDEDLDAFVETTGPSRSDTETSRSWLRSRVDQIRFDLDEALLRQFGLKSDKGPRSFADVLARLTSGKFTIPEDKKDKESYDPLNWVEWRDPSVKKDEAGYRLAEDALDDARKQTLDSINVFDPEKGLAALQALQSWKYVAPAKA